MKYILSVAQIYQDKLYKISSLKKEFLDKEDYEEEVHIFEKMLSLLYDIVYELSIQISLADLIKFEYLSESSLEFNKILNIIEIYFNNLDLFEVKLPKNTANESFLKINISNSKNQIESILVSVMDEIVNFTYTKEVKYQDSDYFVVKSFLSEIFDFVAYLMRELLKVINIFGWTEFGKVFNTYVETLQRAKRDIENTQTAHEQEELDYLMRDLMGEDYEDEEMREAFKKGKYF